MKLHDTALDAVKLIELQIHGDARGFFVERYHKDKLREAGLDVDFVQDNHSRSAPGILRGLHYQHTPPQGKLVGVTRGRVLDVAVDIRIDSPTFGHYVAEELSETNGRLLWVPAGFAHGFCVLGDEPADMLYKVSGLYNADGEGGIRYDDPEIGIAWPIDNPQISARDEGLMSLAEYRANPAPWA
ncbi:MAG: dTDP-4-dehydrorhamnose 3,5-epimerase [Rickettsiales bacterium]|nr:dTDP-4-dehydrorhamnose 3,5-epimerase [Rickettsiales bacterium]|tara:strand:- start:1738 stop:2292 length:555 start_codon:yes stop_codon:yes gene_type:complete